MLAGRRVAAHGAQLRWRRWGHGAGDVPLRHTRVRRGRRRRTLVGHRHRQRVDAVSDFRRQTAVNTKQLLFIRVRYT